MGGPSLDLPAKSPVLGFALTPPPSPRPDVRRNSRVGTCLILAGVLILVALGTASHPSTREARTRLLPALASLESRLGAGRWMLSGGYGPSNASPFDSVLAMSRRDRADRRAHMAAIESVAHLGIEIRDAVEADDPRVREIVERAAATGTVTEAGELLPPAVACRLSHQDAIEEADRRGDRVTLFLEDDVDVELHFNYLARRAIHSLPEDWDLLMFGHCWSDETDRGHPPNGTHPHVYIAHEPQCTHAYALSARGRSQFLAALNHTRHERPAFMHPEFYPSPPDAPIDELIRDVSLSRQINAFSIYPPYAIPMGLYTSDIGGPFDDEFRTQLFDSAALHAGEPLRPIRPIVAPPSPPVDAQPPPADAQPPWTSAPLTDAPFADARPPLDDAHMRRRSPGVRQPPARRLNARHRPISTR